MDLAELRFKVDTKQLEDAAVKLEALGNAVQKLNKPMADNATATAKVVKEQAKAEEAAVKAAAAAEKLQKAQDKSTESTKKSISVLEKQNLILEYMAQGNSRGQASIMATYKAAGALDSQMLELNNTLKTQRTLIGGDPFDKSIGLMQKLQNEYKTTSEVTALFNRNLGLTEKQMTDIAREKERLIALYKIENKDIKGLSAEYENLIRQSVEINNQNDIRTSSMKNQMKAITDTTKANEYLAKELYRVDSALKAENQTLSSGTNNALLRFEKALQSSGMTAADQTVKLEAYRQKLLQLQKASGNRQVDYLSRALGPQLTDIGVGLATGQNPLTVMMQQGGQLRDQFALAGVAGKDMGKMLEASAKSMVSSIKDVTVAVGGLVVSVLTKPFTMPFKRMEEVNAITEKLNDGSISQLRSNRLIEVANGRLAQSYMMVGATATAAFGISLIVAIKEVIDQERELNKAVNLTAANMGLTQNSALELSNKLGSSKGNIGSYVNAITDIGKAGGVASKDLETVAKTIVQVNKVTGISTTELASNFNKIYEKPTEALIKYAKELGTIEVSLLRQVHAYELAGNQAAAATLATNAYSKALKESADRITKDMGYLEKFFYGIGSAAKWMWDKILNIGRKGTLDEQLNSAIEKMKELQAAGGTNVGRKDRMVSAQAAVIEGILKEIEADKELGKQKAKNADDATKFDKQIKDAKGATATSPKDIELEALKKKYSDQTKLVDSEFSKEQALNKSNYELGLTKTGQYLSEELRLIEEQNAAKIELNDKYFVDLKMARDAQLKKVNAEFDRAAGHAKTPEDAAALDKQRKASIESVTAAYANLTDGVRANNEVLNDKAVESSAKAMERLGAITKTSFEAISSGANIGTMFDGALAGAGRFITAIEDIGKTQERTAAAYAANLQLNSADTEKFGELQKRIATVSAYETIHSYGSMAGALKGYAKEGSKTYKALANAEKVFRAFELGLAIKTMIEKTGLLTAFTAAKLTSDKVQDASTIQSAAITTTAAVTEGTALAAVGVANQAKGDPYTAFPRMAAMAAIMAALGFATGMFGGGGGGGAPTNTGTGTVFGDSSAKSESLTKSLEILNDTEIMALDYSQQMAKSLSNIESNIDGFTNLLIRSSGLSNLTGSIKTGAMDSTLTKVDKVFYDAMTFGATKLLPSIMGPINNLYSKTMKALWGKSVSITGAGITGGSQSLGSIGNQGFQGSYYANTETKSKFLGLTYDTSNGTQNSALDPEIERQITSILLGVGTAVKSGALALGEDLSRVNKSISDYVVSLGNIELKGLNGDEIAEKLNNIFGAEADKIAQSVMPGLEDLQKVGEGYFETLTRTAAQLEYVNLQTNRLGANYALIGLQGAKAADSLINLFGTLSDFESSISDFYQNFYTEEERNAKTLDELTKSFSNMGMTLPKTIEDYRSLVNQQNLYSESGQETYANLIKLSSAFSTVTKASDEAAAAAKEQADSMAAAAQEALDSAKDLMRRSGESIADWLKKLTTTSIVPTQTLSSTRSQYLKDLTLSQVGDQTALGNLTTSAQSYLDAARSASTSSSQYRLAIAQVATQVAALPAVKSWNDEVLLKLDLIATYTKGTSVASDETAKNTLDSYLQAIKSLNKLGLISDYTSDAYIEAVKAQGTLGLINYNTDGTENALIKSLTELGLIKSGTDNTASNTNKTATSADEQIKQLVSLQKEGIGSVYNAIAGSYSFYDKMNLNLTEIGKVLEGIRTAGGGSSSSGGGFFTKVGGAAGSVIDTGVSTVKKATNFVSSLFSDARIKENISLYKTLPNGINLYDFNYKAPYSSILGTDTKRGVLAQEVEKMYPSAVSENSQGIKKVDYSKLPIPQDLLKFAKGGTFSNGIIDAPTLFNTALMGEAGPEAIMPLNKLPDGSLGVRAIQSSSSTDNQMLWQAIDRLNTNLDGLRAETRATVVNTSKTAKLLDRVIESDTVKVQTVTV
jgi:hypothetical protein